MKLHFTILTSLLILSAGFSFGQKPEAKFESTQHKFDKTEEGRLLEFTYEFSNKGDAPLLFQDYKVNCNCTKVVLPKQPILPSEQGKIKVSFDTNGKIGFQKRTITIITNAGNYQLLFKGVVKASEATKEAYKEKK